MSNTLDTLRQSLAPDQALLITLPSDITYFTQFQFLTPWEREALLMVTQKSAMLAYASFSPLPNTSNVTFKAGCSLEKIKQYVQELVETEKIASISVDKTCLFVNEHEVISQIPGLTLNSLDRSPIWNLRSIKSVEEIANVKQAAQITIQAYKTVISRLREGMTELELKTILENELRRLGANDLAFPTIVAFGQHTALPHHQPMDTPLTKNSPVLVDMGAKVAGYCADLTRTTWFGDKVDPEFSRREQIVTSAYNAALNILSKKTATVIKAKDLDAAARKIIADAGYGPDFNHTTGHGLGLDIHEFPSISWKNEAEIQPGMIITIEPGIYQNENFGYRYENTVLVTENGCEVLTEK